jgi:hypothetical protein
VSCQRGASDDSETAFPRHAQREILKAVHDASGLAEVQRALLPDGIVHWSVDVETALDALCFVAGNINEGLLSVSSAELSVLDGIVRAVVEESIDVEVLKSTDIAQLVWVLEIVERVSGCGSAGDAGRAWRLQVVKRIAERETKVVATGGAGGGVIAVIASYSTRDLTNLACSIGNTRLFSSSAPVVRFMMVVLDELATRIEKPHVRSAFALRDFSMLAAAAAGAHEASRSDEILGACEGFLTRLWRDGAKPKLVNRHSSGSTVSALGDLKGFLFSYVRVFPDELPDRMMEVVSSYLTRMLKEDVECARQARSPSVTLADLAAVLEFFAFYAAGTASSMPQISVIEMVSVVGVCMRQLTLAEDSNMEAIASIFESHIALDLRPAQETLLAVVPYVYHNRMDDDRILESILVSFRTFGFEPGEALSTSNTGT